eukprot:12939032-Prorocentrum_lima.AAC.1
MQSLAQWQDQGLGALCRFGSTVRAPCTCFRARSTPRCACVCVCVLHRQFPIPSVLLLEQAVHSQLQ